MPVSRNRILPLAPLCLGLFLSQAEAQTVGELPSPSGDTTVGRGRPETYGTQSESVYSLNAWEFQIRDPGVTTSFVASLQRYSTDNAVLYAGIHLPEGALITKFEIAGCDTNATLGLYSSILACSDPNGTCNPVAIVNSPFVGAPGCAFFSSVGFPTLTIDNLNNTYLIAVVLGSDSALTFRNVRVYYRLQVSPAPVAATFDDVPVGHPCTDSSRHWRGGNHGGLRSRKLLPKRSCHSRPDGSLPECGAGPTPSVRG